MFSLPTSSTSTYGVGSTTFATPIQPPLAFGNAETKDGKAVLVLNEVAFTVYYPADISSRPKSGVDWAMRPLNGTLRGFTSFAERIPRWILWPFVYCYAALLKIPAYPNAPLLHPKDKPWPLVVFSHGLGGSRTAYSQLCTRLAGTGKVIIAIEHRDGTSICVTPREWTEGGRRTPKVIPYIREQDLRRSSKSEQNTLVLRTEQLEFRRQEVYSAFSAFLSILRHTDQQPPQVELVDGAPIDLSSWRSDGDHTLVECAKDVTLSGHSFGGCTAFDIISTPPLAGFPRIPITKLLIYDPWLEPIPSPGPTPLDIHKTYIQRQVASNMHGGPVSSEDEEATASLLPEILVVNSEAFTIWKDHFERLEDILNTWGPRATLLTLAKSAHPHFSDFLLLPLVPKRKVGVTLMECIDRLSNAFVDGRLAEQLTAENTRKMEVEIVGKRKDGRPKRELRGAVGEIIVH